MEKITEYEVESLKEFINKSDGTIYTYVQYVNTMGTSRRVVVFVVNDGKIVNISYYVAKYLGLRYNRDWGAVVVSGCGEDVGFKVVHELSYSLFGDGYKLKQKWL